MRRKGRALLYLRGVMIFLALLLPMISLLPLGWLWLWQKGYALYWLAGAFTLSIFGYLLQARALHKSVTETAKTHLIEDAEAVPPDPGWTAREQAAWAAVEAVAADVRTAELTDRDKVLNLGLRTIETVARQIHPEDRNPLWKFTIPEALALVERVSADLRPFVVDNIPLGDQLTVGQVLKFYQWRSAIGMAEKAYDIWRLIRLMNPVTAAAQEAREQITKRLYATVRDQVARQLAQGYVREVGRAAIDLYGGRLRVSAADLAGHVSASTLRDRSLGKSVAEPLRILVAGNAGSGKSSIVHAIASEVGTPIHELPPTQKFVAHELELEGLASALVIDSPSVGASAKEQRRFADKAGECDLILWAIDATSDADAKARDTVTAIRKYFSDRPHRRQPPILVALTHVDLLGAGDKDPRVREEILQIAELLGVTASDVVPVSVGAGHEPENIQLLLQRIAAREPQARQAQLLRLMEDAAPRLSASRLGRQASSVLVSAARAVTPSYFKRWTGQEPRK